MPAGNIKVLEHLMELLSLAADSFIILSTHSDVDILVRKEHKTDVVKILEACAFRKEEISSAENLECLYGAEPVTQYYHFTGCHVDLHTGLNYISSWDLYPSHLVPVNNEFQEYAHDTKVKTEDMWRYRLSPESEVVHTVCRIIFDKISVPPHYRDRLERNLDKCDKEELARVFGLALFKAGSHMSELVINRKFDDLYEEYIGYADY
tara:strand:+ start:51 stop:671 length:621 start_codon:yes stop_codon:yes gene_type:complete